MGTDTKKWPAQGVVTVPVEMLESWVLYALDPQRDELPYFSAKKQKLAMTFYKGNPPDQLKDLCEVERERLGMKRTVDVFLEAAEKMDIESVSARSQSFAEFVTVVETWAK